MSQKSKNSTGTDPIIEKIIEALKMRKIIGVIADNADHARELICNIVHEGAVIGIGDSSSVRQVNAVTTLEERGHRVINGFNPKNKITDLQSHFDNGFWPMLEATVCDVFLTGSNAITEDGRIIKQHEEHMVLCPMPECIFEKGNNEKLWEMARQKKRGVVWP